MMRKSPSASGGGSSGARGAPAEADSSSSRSVPRTPRSTSAASGWRAMYSSGSGRSPRSWRARNSSAIWATRDSRVESWVAGASFIGSLQDAAVGEGLLQPDQSAAVAFAGGGRLDVEQDGDLVVRERLGMAHEQDF